MGDRTILLWSAILFLTLLPGIQHGLWRPDEPQVAGVCAEMAHGKEFVVPRLNGRPFLEKPPLYYALGATFGILFGKDNDLSYRLASTLFACLTLFVTFRMVSIRDGLTRGLLASGILASSGSFFRLARWIQVDMSLVFSVTLAMYAYIELFRKSTLRYSVLMGLGIGLSFMAKGLVGPAIIGSAVVTDIILKRDLSIIKKIRSLWILAIMLISILPWILALYERGGFPFLREVIVVNNLMRFTGASEGAALGHMHGPFYYLKVFPLNFLPWTLAFIPALGSFIKRPQENPYLPWFIGPFILLSIASAKRGLYLIPLYPACACMTALWLSRMGNRKWEGLIVKVIWGVAAILCFAPFLGVLWGRPVLGIIFGLLSLTSSYVISRLRSRDVLSLVMVVCASMSAFMTVYYAAMKEKRDYLGFTREALHRAKGSEIIVLMPDEIFEGVLPLITGKRYRVVERLTDIKEEGLYLWADKDESIVEELEKIAKLEMVFEKKIGERNARLAFISPKTGMR
ncbi:MAG: glycosyltransferase family 39 protein [Syntrophaceae bacterium]|nr:glycosyltransferase family 39 protein [Syntrophaceae bacterium]